MGEETNVFAGTYSGSTYYKCENIGYNGEKEGQLYLSKRKYGCPYNKKVKKILI